MNILVLDDDSFIRSSLKILLGEEHNLIMAFSFASAVEALDREEVDAAIIDIDLKEKNHNGIDFLRLFKARYPEKPVLIESGSGDIETVVKCMKFGADDYLEKPANSETILLKVNKMATDARKQRVFHRTLEKSNAVHQIIGQSEGILHAKSVVERARDMRILFYGETGVGKTPFALYSNQIVSRLEGQARPFEQINCACLTHEHFQDQLFGHKKGAFTGAIADKRGLVELARGGDLFLDEIGDMRLETQTLFLTFLDSMEYYRLGDDQKRKAQVRILCATNKDLRQMVKEGRFRADLFSRISQVIVNIPALRSRPTDIPPLFEYFVEKFSNYPKPYDPALMSILQKFDWGEGNVRELRDAVEYLCIMAKESERIEVHHLSDHYRPIRGATKAPENRVEAQLDGSVSEHGLDNYLGFFERRVLENCLKQPKTMEAIAKELKISRPTLYRRLKKYDLANLATQEE